MEGFEPPTSELGTISLTPSTLITVFQIHTLLCSPVMHLHLCTLLPTTTTATDMLTKQKPTLIVVK